MVKFTTLLDFGHIVKSPLVSNEIQVAREFGCIHATPSIPVQTGA